MAQSPDLVVYSVADVGVDVTADSAAHARDQAIVTAQRAAFNQLLDRLDAPTALAAKLKDDDIAALVQNFEVQSERSSSVRYIGTFTVQFRPNAVRKYLTARGLIPNETRSKPILILPIYVSNGHPILWEEATRWNTAWSKVAADAGLVPIILPTGGLEDIAIISTDEAVAGKPEALKALADKYQANGVAVVTLSGNLDAPTAGLAINLVRYDSDGKAYPAEPVDLPPVADKNGVDDALMQGVRLTRHQLETDWKLDTKTPPSAALRQAAISGDDQPVTVETGLPPVAPVVHLPVTVVIATLAEWAQIRNTLSAVPGVVRINVLSLQRGSASIEIEMRGNVQDLQTALAQQHLRLTQDLLSNTWMLRGG